MQFSSFKWLAWLEHVITINPNKAWSATEGLVLAWDPDVGEIAITFLLLNICFHKLQVNSGQSWRSTEGSGKQICVRGIFLSVDFKPNLVLEVKFVVIIAVL